MAYRGSIPIVLRVASILAVAAVALAARADRREARDAPRDDHFAPIRYLAGDWEGTSEGEPGKGKVKRTCEAALGGRFLRVHNRSAYPPTEKIPRGEIHDDFGIFSFDRNRNTIVLRQFHAEGFVNQYTLTSKSDEDKTVVFTTEAIENITPGWRARETYKMIGRDEFIETFEMAAPGKEFEVYSKSTLRRKGRAAAEPVRAR